MDDIDDMTYEKMNAQAMRAVNTRSILNIIRREGAVARTGLAAKTGLTTGTVTNIVGGLLEKGYLIESGRGDSIGGRRPVFLELNAAAGYMAGLELGASGITCVVGDFKGRLLSRKNLPVHVPDGKDRIISQMADLVENSVAGLNIDRRLVLGLGLAIPGPCDYVNGVMLNPPNFPDWIDVPIRRMLGDRLAFPVYASKETSCAVLSEFWFGSGPASNRLFGITVGRVGIGGALVLDGEIFQEREGESMDIGHTIVQTDGDPCSCGSRGCLEVQADGQAAVRYARGARLPELDFDGLVRGTAAGEPDCVEAVKKCAFYISVGLGNMVALLSPQSLYFGGEFMERCPLLYEKTVEYMNRRQYPAGVRNTEKAPFTYGKSSGAVGGLALVLDALSKTL